VATEFVGYDMMTLEDPQLLKQFVIDDEHYMIFDRTPFFPTGGGQQHDIGCIVIDDDRYYVVDVIRYEHVIIHHVSTAA
jgi:alanyl-tRNA synthetase